MTIPFDAAPGTTYSAHISGLEDTFENQRRLMLAVYTDTSQTYQMQTTISGFISGGLYIAW